MNDKRSFSFDVSLTKSVDFGKDESQKMIDCNFVFTRAGISTRDSVTISVKNCLISDFTVKPSIDQVSIRADETKDVCFRLSDMRDSNVCGRRKLYVIPSGLPEEVGVLQSGYYDSNARVCYPISGTETLSENPQTLTISVGKDENSDVIKTASATINFDKCHYYNPTIEFQETSTISGIISKSNISFFLSFFPPPLFSFFSFFLNGRLFETFIFTYFGYKQ